MRTNTEVQKGVETLSAQVCKHWAAKEAYLDELIGAESAEETQLDLHVHGQPEANRFEVRAVLSLPSARLAAEAVDENVGMALDRVADLLAQAVRQHRGGTSALAEKIDEVEEASAGSFPASDAPSWTHVTIKN